MKNKSGDNVILRVSALTSLAVGWFFCIVLPVQSYLSNADNFAFGLNDLLAEYLLTGLVLVFALGAILQFLSRWFGLRFHIVLLALVLACIFESGPLSIGLSEFNGIFDGYRLVWRMVLDWSVWGVIVLSSIAFYSRIRDFAMWIAIVLIVYSTAMMFDVRKGGKEGPAVDSSLRSIPLVSREDVVDSAIYSADHNVVMLVIDAVSTDAATYAFEQDPKLCEKFIGFVNYTNNVGMHLTTAVAIPGIMTGEYCQGSRDAVSYGKRPYMRGSWLFDYVDAGYAVYSNLGIGQKGYTNRYNPMKRGGSGCKPSEVKVLGTFSWSVNSLSCVRILPYALKEWYVRRLTSVASRERGGNIESDAYLWPHLADAPVEAAVGKVLNIHHSYGGHVPIVFDRDGRRMSAQNEDYHAYKEQCLYVFRQLGALLDAYREKGIYDRSSIVILADHGSHMPDKTSDGVPIARSPYPVLLVKLPGASRPLMTSALPTSHANVARLMRSFVSGSPTRDELDEILRSDDRYYRFCTNAQIVDFHVREDGSVVKRSQPDREPDLSELAPLRTGCLYSFDIADLDCPYPDFVVENGARNASTGLAFVKNSMSLRFKVAEPVDATLRMRSWRRDVDLVVTDGCGNPKGQFKLRARRVEDVVIRDLTPDSNGIVSIDFRRNAEDEQMVLLTASLSSARRGLEVPAMETGVNYVFGKNTSPHVLLVSGFSSPESFGVWSDGAACVIRVNIPLSQDELQLIFSAHSFSTMKSFFVRCAGRNIGTFDASRHSGFEFAIDCKGLPAGRPVDLEFVQPDAARPCDMNMGSPDVRRLGLGFRSVRLVQRKGTMSCRD